NHEAPQGRHRGPAWHRIVGNVDEPTGFEPSTDEGDNGVPVFRTDPAIDAVHAYNVELGQGSIVQQFREIRFTKFDILEPSRPSKPACPGKVRRIEINRETPGTRIGGGDDICRKPLPASEVEIAERLAKAARDRHTLGQGRKAQESRHLHPTEIVN